MPPFHRATATPTLPSEKMTGRYTLDQIALRTLAPYMRSVRMRNSARLSASRTSVLVVRTPLRPSLYAAVMLELARRAWRSVVRIRFWKIMLTQIIGGTTISTSRPSCHWNASSSTETPTSMKTPQIRSSTPHARIRESRSQSLVSLAMSQPTGRRS